MSSYFLLFLLFFVFFRREVVGRPLLASVDDHSVVLELLSVYNVLLVLGEVDGVFFGDKFVDAAGRFFLLKIANLSIRCHVQNIVVLIWSQIVSFRWLLFHASIIGTIDLIGTSHIVWTQE